MGKVIFAIIASFLAFAITFYVSLYFASAKMIELDKGMFYAIVVAIIVFMLTLIISFAVGGDSKKDEHTK